jgi:hypothetical protein
MCNDEAWNVVIFSINANIYVFVHVDLHEIYLLMLKTAKLVSKTEKHYFACKSDFYNFQLGHFKLY